MIIKMKIILWKNCERKFVAFWGNRNTENRNRFLLFFPIQIDKRQVYAHSISIITILEV